jgi:hypothetical protein
MMQVMHQLHGKQMIHRLFLGAVFLRKGEAKAATWPRRDCPVVVTPEPAGEAVADSDTRKRGGGGYGRSLGGSDTTGGQDKQARGSRTGNVFACVNRASPPPCQQGISALLTMMLLA